mgnify:CR=1 FL=1
MRDAFIRETYERAKVEKDLIFITNEQGASSLDIFREKIPNQLPFKIGVLTDGYCGVK